MNWYAERNSRIREDAARLTTAQLAAAYGLSDTTIYRILTTRYKNEEANGNARDLPLRRGVEAVRPGRVGAIAGAPGNVREMHEAEGER